jgi:hypothetical protein
LTNTASTRDAPTLRAVASELEDFAQLAAAHERHGEEHAAVRVEPDFVDRHDARVVELARDLRFLEEAREHALAFERRARDEREALVAQHLHRDVAAQVGVPGLVDDAHAAARELVLDHVAALERAVRGEAREHVVEAARTLPLCAALRARERARRRARTRVRVGAAGLHWGRPTRRPRRARAGVARCVRSGALAAVHAEHAVELGPVGVELAQLGGDGGLLGAQAFERGDVADRMAPEELDQQFLSGRELRCGEPGRGLRRRRQRRERGGALAERRRSELFR